MKKKIIIAVTGKQGSGKSTLCNYLAKEINADLFNLDIYAHKALKDEKVKNILVKKFGVSIIENGEINRKTLGKIVFKDKSKLNFLNAVTYNFMEKAIKADIEKAKDIVILDYALLPLTSFWGKADYKILMDANLEIRMQRLALRDSVDESYLKSREKASLDYSNLKVDRYIENNGNLNYSAIAKQIKTAILQPHKQNYKPHSLLLNQFNYAHEQH